MKKINAIQCTVALFITTLCFVDTNDAFAWSEMGHKMVGAIAEDALTPKGKALVRGIIGIEPLAISAVWADEVRDDPRFSSQPRDLQDPEEAMHDFAPYHFCDIRPGEEYLKHPKLRDCHAIMKFTKDLIKDPRNLRETKMIALRYLIHVVGDIHQPLHVGNGFDRGGNACKVKWQRSPEGRAIIVNFHSFWDGTIVDLTKESMGARYYNDFYKALKTKRPESFTKTAQDLYSIKTSGPLDWLKEAQILRDRIYPDEPGSMDGVPENERHTKRPYCLWYTDQTTDKDPAPGSVIDLERLPLLTAASVQHHQELVELQLIKAGLRLASMINEIAEEAQESGVQLIDDEKEKDIFRKIFLTLRNFIW